LRLPAKVWVETARRASARRRQKAREAVGDIDEGVR
jgi:hypothetical protein